MENKHQTEQYYSGFYPVKLSLVVAGDNFFPLAWWTVASKEPFRFLLAIDRKNYSLEIIQNNKECILQFMPWSERQHVIQAGYMSGKKKNKAKLLDFNLLQATVLTKTSLVEGFETAFELKLQQEIDSADADHQLIVFDVVHVHRRKRGVGKDPIFFNGFRSFNRLGEAYDFQFKSLKEET